MGIFVCVFRNSLLALRKICYRMTIWELKTMTERCNSRCIILSFGPIEWQNTVHWVQLFCHFWFSAQIVLRWPIANFVWHSWWRHQMETFSALLAMCAGNSPVPGEFPAQRPMTRSFDVFFDLHLNKRLSKQSWGWWFDTSWRPLQRHCNTGNALSQRTHHAIMTSLLRQNDVILT